MQQTNLICLAENYHFKYYLYHYLSWPNLLYVAEDQTGKIVGYVLAKLEESESNKKKPNEEPKLEGHITSLSVLRTYRRLGIANKLMIHTMNMMQEYYDADCVLLHVRVTNKPAINLYNKVLGFVVKEIEKEYYNDKEDAYRMTKFFKNSAKEDVKILEIVDDIHFSDITNFELINEHGEEISDDGANDNEKKHKKKKNKKK